MMYSFNNTLNITTAVKPPTDIDMERAKLYSSKQKMVLLIDTVEQDIRDPCLNAHTRFEKSQNTRYRHAVLYSRLATAQKKDVIEGYCETRGSCECQYWRTIALDCMSILNPSIEDKMNHRHKYNQYKSVSDNIIIRLDDNINLLKWVKWVYVSNKNKYVSSKVRSLIGASQRQAQALRNSKKMAQLKARTTRRWK
jgi:hypothetical protein